ncbi:MAG: hypothetical protein M1832_005973 [Thelocarpon impressellum]|nr:MAG: hypothetical protein M1832_005973 [Thelocarpon impressellum]
MLYSINVIRGGSIVGALSFFVWSLPAAIPAYGLAVGVSKIDDRLPAPVYALLSGLNSATVGVVALAAVQLSGKAITDKLTRVLVFFGGAAGMLYNALWYFPVLMVVAGIATVVWDFKWLHRPARRIKNLVPRHRQEASRAEEGAVEPTEMQDVSQPSSARETSSDFTTRRAASQGKKEEAGGAGQPKAATPASTPAELDMAHTHAFSWVLGVAIIAGFLATFIAIMVLRGTLRSPPRAFSVFANLYLAGTIIFGGGPVLIPLLREYVVAQGWVSTRDFLLGLALIQAFPGPNFNFAVYLGALAVGGSGTNSATGAVIGYVAIFFPGLVLHTGTMGIWRQVRRYRAVTSCLRGVNAAAVGLIYAAVYRLWEMGYLSEGAPTGQSLGKDPWWLVITATAFVGGMWFNVDPPVAILLGGVMGMVWYGVVTS